MAQTEHQIDAQIHKWEEFRNIEAVSVRERQLLISFCQWRDVIVRDEVLKTLASAIKKQFPEQAKAIVDKIAERDFAFEKFLNFMRSE